MEGKILDFVFFVCKNMPRKNWWVIPPFCQNKVNLYNSFDFENGNNIEKVIELKPPKGW